MNLYIAPRGECYPCYALMGSAHMLGNALEQDLADILKKNDRYRRATVDSNDKCCLCTLRYVCGGFCRAWSVNGSPDSAPRGCSALQKRARTLVVSALETLEIEMEQWITAGLPAE
jgi:radical SAM protein with 4Fe4S-binding SPASM domain